MGACMSRCMKGDENSSKPTRLQEYDIEYDAKTMVPLNEDPDAYTEIDLNDSSVKSTSGNAINKRPAESQIPFELAMVNSITRQKLEMNRPKMTETLELTPFTRAQPPNVPILGPNALSSPKGPNVLFKADFAKSPFQRHLDFKREKNNSTSSLYIKDSIVRPDMEELIRCTSVAILYHIREGMKKRHVSYDIFNEERHPLTFGRVDVTATPDIATVYRFLKIIFKSQKIASECAIMCLAFVERLIATTGITLYPSNWRRITLGALILATKVWEEDAVWNADFIDVFPNLTVRDLNLLERTWLDLLQYNVEVSASQYAKYYFELRALSEIDSRHFPLKPMDQEAAMRLERRSLKIKKDVKGLQRSKSLDHFTMKSPQAVVL